MREYESSGYSDEYTRLFPTSCFVPLRVNVNLCRRKEDEIETDESDDNATVSPSMYDLDLDLGENLPRTDCVEAFVLQIIEEAKTCTHDIFMSGKFYRWDELKVGGLSLQPVLKVGSPICLHVTTRSSAKEDLYSLLIDIFEHISQKHINSDMPRKLWGLSIAWNKMIYSLTRSVTFRRYLDFISGINERNPTVEDRDFATAYVRMVSALKLRLKNLLHEVMWAHSRSLNVVNLPCIKIYDLIYDADLKPTIYIPLDL